MKSLLILYSHFAPAYKAGGPVQSLVNMVEVLHTHYRIYVVCSAYEYGETNLLLGIEPDQWNPYQNNVSVFYSTGYGYNAVRRVMKEIHPDMVYINGMYLSSYNVFALWLAHRYSSKIIVAPRGMLQKGALTIRSRKKKLFLACFKFFNLQNEVTWHATDGQEKKDIENQFGSNARVTIAPNVPKAPLAILPSKEKKRGELRLIYLSLITEKKNLHLILEALKFVQTPIQFDIYGPVKDEAYWLQCVKSMRGQIHTIEYKGLVKPTQVQSVLSKYHMLALPTRGENFGHAIYEALSVGTPVITSPFTPWGNIQSQGGGFIVENSPKMIAETVELLSGYDNSSYQETSSNAHKIAIEYFYKHNYAELYTNLFND